LNIVKIITFLTDFGTADGYVAQMKGVAASITTARLIDLSHHISSHNICEGAFLLRCSAPCFPDGTVHVAVVDPGVGTRRKGIIVITRKQILVGPDNGLLIPTARFLGDFIVYEISNEKYTLGTISNTFHARDVFTPVAAHITNEIPFEELGQRVDDFVDLELKDGEIHENFGKGTVAHIDKFGNVITNIPGDFLLQKISYDHKLKVQIRKKAYNIPVVPSYGHVKKGQLLVTIGSSNYLELSLNQGSASEKLSIKQNDPIRIDFN